MNLLIQTFEQLSTAQLYAILRLRQQVFMLEQQSLYEDIDNLDDQAHHFYIETDGQLIGYARLRLADSNGTKMKIERVLTDAKHRGLGLGHRLMESAIAWSRALDSVRSVHLSSQVSALDFYRRYGFVVKGQPYDDGGIEHQDMTLQLNRD